MIWAAKGAIKARIPGTIATIVNSKTTSLLGLRRGRVGFLSGEVIFKCTA
jgi:hypothetical protein